MVSPAQMKKTLSQIALALASLCLILSWAHAASCEDYLRASRVVDEFIAARDKAYSSQSENAASYWSKILIEKATQILEARGVAYDLIELEDGRAAIQILPEKSLPGLNFLAFGLFERQEGMRLTYNPYELIKDNSGGYFHLEEKRISIPHEAIYMGAAESGLRHELRHAVLGYQRAHGIDSIFHGWAVARAGLPLSEAMQDKPLYRKEMHFEELSTFVLELVATVTKLNAQFKKNGPYISYCLNLIANRADYGRAVATQTLELVDKALGLFAGPHSIAYSKGENKIWAAIDVDGARALVFPFMGDEPQQLLGKLDGTDKQARKKARQALDRLVQARLTKLRMVARELRPWLVYIQETAQSPVPYEWQVPELVRSIQEAREITLRRDE